MFKEVDFMTYYIEAAQKNGYEVIILHVTPEVLDESKLVYMQRHQRDFQEKDAQFIRGIAQIQIKDTDIRPALAEMAASRSTVPAKANDGIPDYPGVFFNTLPVDKTRHDIAAAMQA
jgi:hypothetical protein